MSYPKKIFYKDLILYVDENVYHPAEDTYLLAENLNVKKNDVVLDVGTGCGIIALLSAKKAKEVVAIDINPYAVKCAKKNAKLNNLSDKIEFIIGDLFQPLRKKEKFTKIFFNAPYLPVENEKKDNWIEYAWKGGVTGRKVIEAFIADVYYYLRKGGKVILVQSTLSSVERTLQDFKKMEFSARIAASSKFMFETVVLIEAVKK